MSEANKWGNPNIDDLTDEIRERNDLGKKDQIYKIRVFFDRAVGEIYKDLTQKEVSDIYKIIERFFK